VAGVIIVLRKIVGAFPESTKDPTAGVIVILLRTLGAAPAIAKAPEGGVIIPTIEVTVTVGALLAIVKPATACVP
jgi:hypothetical protein